MQAHAFKDCNTMPALAAAQTSPPTSQSLNIYLLVRIKVFVALILVLILILVRLPVPILPLPRLYLFKMIYHRPISAAMHQNLHQRNSILASWIHVMKSGPAMATVALVEFSSLVP